jgi:voltage-gated potassium channel Kch
MKEARMRKITWQDRIRYAFDRTISRGPMAMIIWLFCLSVALIVTISLLVSVSGIAPEGKGFLQIAWASLLRTLDAGTMGGDQGSWPFLLSMLTVTLGGVFIVSTLIGVLSAGIEDRLEQFRRGRSFVAEEGHTVILGWSKQVFTIVSELLIANANQPHACIAILADKDKVEMEEELRTRVGDTGRTRVVCRRGQPTDLVDLEIVNPHAARSIIILAPETERPDAFVIEGILALLNNPHRRAEPYHIVAAIRERANLEVAQMVGGGEVQLVLAGDLTAKIAAQTCRQPGLSVAYTELLNFSGDEIYFQEELALVGRTFAEALLAYEDSAVMGLCSAGGRVRLNPAMDTVIANGDRVIAISEDDDTVRLSGLVDRGIDYDAIREPQPRQPNVERALILGWNARAATVVWELHHYMPPGSQVTVVAMADTDEAAAEIAAQCAADGQGEPYCDLTVSFQRGDTTNRRTLDALQIPSYHHVIVLCYCDRFEAQEADEHTLVTLLHLRQIAERHNHPFSIVSEMLDVRKRDLAEVTRADDFIISDQLVSLILAQISENKGLKTVLDDLFDAEGSELYLKPAEDYVQLGRPLNFYTVVEAAKRRGEVAVGYRQYADSHNPLKSYGVRVNPDKSKRVTFADQDRIIVLAED